MNWQRLEAFIRANKLTGKPLDPDRIARMMKVSPWEVRHGIQQYKSAQQYAPTAYVVYRAPGTRGPASRWIFGTRVVDAQAVGLQLVDDMRCRMRRQIVPTLVAIGFHNGSAKQTADAVADMLETHIKLMAAAL